MWGTRFFACFGALREEAAVGHACALALELCGEEDRRGERCADRVEEVFDGRVEGGFGGSGAVGADVTEFLDVLGDEVGGGHGLWIEYSESAGQRVMCAQMSGVTGIGSAGLQPEDLSALRTWGRCLRLLQRGLTACCACKALSLLGRLGLLCSPGRLGLLCFPGVMEVCGTGG